MTKIKKKVKLTKAKEQAVETAPKRRGRKPEPLIPYPGPDLTLGSERVKEVPVAKLNLDDETFQIRFSSKPDKTLTDSISSTGIQFPLIVRPHPDKEGEFQIVCGFRRANAALLLEKEKVPVVIRSLEDEEAHIVAYTENEYRKTLRDLDRAHAMAKLKQAGRNNTEIGALYRLSRRQVQRIERLLDYPNELIEALDNDRISTTQALILWQAKQKYGGKFHLKEWIDTVQEEGSVADLKNAIKASFSTERVRGVLIHRTAGGDKVAFSLKAIKAVPVEERGSVIEELESLLAELRA